MPFQEREYSEQTKDILGKLPSWIVRWGMTVIFLILAGIIVGSCLIKYPQIVTAPITITTINPPSDLIAKSTGRIDSIFAKDGELLEIGDPVAVLQNTASYDDVKLISNAVENFNLDSSNTWVEGTYKVGELQGNFSELRQQYLNYAHYVQAENTAKKRVLLSGQIDKYNKYIGQLRSQRKLIAEDYDYSAKNYNRDSLLYTQNVISALELERSAQMRLQKRNAIASFESSLTSTEMSLLQMEQQLVELEMQYDNEISAYTRQISECTQKLKAQIRQWEQSYLLKSPIQGRLSFYKYWSSNQNIQMGEKLATVVPEGSAQVIGIMTLPSAGFGRVALGQTVNVKLNGFPYFEYGILKGVVTRLSTVQDVQNTSTGTMSGYIAEITFPNGLQSTYKEQLRLIQQMDGTGDIITRDERLIARFIQPIRALFDKVTN